ncbi:G-alpha-domain-containing protein [Fistulina hepatica ATCC 64428]|uniref:G-alpha-domain-containing protein n=1 Tax=Fistulina hepatica ATCC 64428 TaxID=1128425 RepID=A0A0D7ABQ0_9AGAR|nr:G-alpha-domain-containing protein [Fistulina hepatica ATCC 64428]
MRIAEWDENDPLAVALAPPLNETPEERDIRILTELEEKATSDRIDRWLEEQRAIEKKSLKPIKLLLLGKSTTLKNFQIMYDPKTMRDERLVWRAIIQLNVVHSVHIMLAEVGERAYKSNDDDDDDAVLVSSDFGELLRIKGTLEPSILAAERTLVETLTHQKYDDLAGWKRSSSMGLTMSNNFFREISVNALQRRNVFKRNVSRSLPPNPGLALREYLQDIQTLWRHVDMAKMMARRKTNVTEMAGFAFLDVLDEVYAEDYLPSDDDILRARLKTVGVSEHRFRVPGYFGLSDWRVYDVGGQRSLVTAWIPYFSDNLHSILFLAPVSAFNQVLEEAPKVNRLEDSILLWSSIVSNKLLKSTEIILFLNKCDLLKQKLEAGIKVKDYVVSFRDRRNDFETVTTYLQRKFAGILKDRSPVKRVFYCHLTSVVDKDDTRLILGSRAYFAV